MTESLRTSVSDDSMSTRYSLTEDDRSTVSPPALDYVHPILEDDEQDLMDSFGDKVTSSKDLVSLMEDDEPDYDHLADSPIVLKSLHNFQPESPDHSPFSPEDSESDYDHIAPLESTLDIKVSPQRRSNSSSPNTHSHSSTHDKDRQSRAIRRRAITGKRPDYSPNGYTRTHGDQSPSNNRGGIVFSANPDVLQLNSTAFCSSPDSGVQDDFASAVNSTIVNQSIFNSRKANARNHS